MIAVYRTSAVLGLLLLAVVAWLLPYQLNVYAISVADTALLFALLAVGMGLAMGIAGQVNLAQIAFFGVGAYVTAILTTHGRVRLLGRRPCWRWRPRRDRAGGRDARAADPVALPGDRHARAGRRVRQLDHQRAGRPAATQGISGIPTPPLFGIDLSSQYLYYYLELVVFALAGWRSGCSWCARRWAAGCGRCGTTRWRRGPRAPRSRCCG